MRKDNLPEAILILGVLYLIGTGVLPVWSVIILICPLYTWSGMATDNDLKKSHLRLEEKRANLLEAQAEAISRKTDVRYSRHGGLFWKEDPLRDARITYLKARAEKLQADTETVRIENDLTRERIKKIKKERSR